MSYSKDSRCHYCPPYSECGEELGKLYCFQQVSLDQFLPVPTVTKIFYGAMILLVASIVIGAGIFMWRRYGAAIRRTCRPTVTRASRWMIRQLEKIENEPAKGAVTKTNEDDSSMDFDTDNRAKKEKDVEVGAGTSEPK